jgi:predicted dienelactone hydrolase
VAQGFVIPTLTILLLAACASAPTTTPQPTATVPQHTPTASGSTQEPAFFPLSEPGLYHVGIRRNFAFQDASRGGREVTITVWYPAAMPQDSTSTRPASDAVADPIGAPYPLILSSSKAAFVFGAHLASHGFVVVGINGLDYYIPWDHNLIDQPLDILFALDQVATNPLEGLEGMIDAQHAGAMGYSFDGYNALALSGARVDPEFYLAECARTPLRYHWILFGYCSMSSAWDQFATHAGDAITTSDDGLWQPMTDERIRAVMPMAPEGAALFGERGLSAVDRPTLIIGATDDVDCDYNHEAVYIFEHIGTADKRLISFVGQDHYMVFDPQMVSRMAHFAVAFFGYHLQGRDDYAAYFSQEFVDQHDDLAWGAYEGE